MRRGAIGVSTIGVGVVVVRALAPKLHARLVTGCERMFEQMPDSFPPKRMMRGIEEIRATSARTLALLEAREQEGEPPTVAEESSKPGAARLSRREERGLAGVGATIPEQGLEADA